MTVLEMFVAWILFVLIAGAIGVVVAMYWEG